MIAVFKGIPPVNLLREPFSIFNVGMHSASLELKFITEKIRRRFGVMDSLEGTTWDPKVMEVPPGNRFLVISPHPDDDAIGCMGTLLKLRDNGSELRTLSIQSGNFTQDERISEINAAIRECDIQNCRLNKSSFPNAADLKDMISDEILTFQPDTILVPSPFENHDEHLRAFHAVADLLENNNEINVMMYEVWGALMPNLVIPISETMEKKLSVIRMHGTQMEDIDYVRMVRGINEYRAAMNRLEGYAESFIYMPGKDMKKMF